MLFNSFSFLIFFPVVTAVYFLLPHRFRWFWLLVTSCFFYMSFVPVYILVLAFTIVVDYCAGILIARANTTKTKKAWLIASLIANIGVLAVFKYANFAIININDIVLALHWNYSLDLLKIILPIGLSFHTFQSMSYTIEVYRGKQPVEKNFGLFALYVMFFPQLVAGPIERPQHLLPQFKEPHNFDYDKVVSGLKLMTWGFLKKIVLADRLAEYVNPVYGNVHEYQGWPLVVATVFFAWQIYYDFSGYSDIARGAARVLGFELMVNFNNPYHAKSIAEFWQRWHISLTSWFKEYVYIPLGGNRVTKIGHYRNVLIVFLLSGLWHGANWTFVIWGGLNGVYLVFSDITLRWRVKIQNFFISRWFNQLKNPFLVFTNFILVCFGWIFFRATSLDDAKYILQHLFLGSGMMTGLTNLGYVSREVLVGRGVYNFVVVILAVIAVETVSAYAEKRNISIEQSVAGRAWPYRWGAYYSIIIAILLLGVLGQTSFIYFQF